MGCLPISHLLFVDDLIIFSSANIREAHAIGELLDRYEAWSGQWAKRAKSALFCSQNTHLKVVVNLGNALHVKKMSLNNKYLGLPLLIWRSKKKSFDDVKSKVLSKVWGWKMRSLSQAGRTVLIKSLATAMLLYSMSTFLLPKGWYEDIDRTLKDFWWSFPPKKKSNFTPKA